MDDSNQNTFPPSPYSSQIPNLQVPSISSQPIQRASARSNRSRGLLHNKKRLKTLGPPRRVLISNSDSDNSSSKCMELEDSFVEKLSPVFETNDREIEVVSLEPDVNSDTEQQGMASSFNHGRERVEEASVSLEISEHRKRKAGEANRDNSISLVLSMNSPASHYESDEDHIFSQHGHEQFDIAEFRSDRHVIDVKSKTPCFQKLNVQENISGNSSRNPKFSTDCNVVKQNLFEKPSFKMSLSNPVAAESSRRVHFSVLESSSRADDMELSGKFGMDKQIYKTHGSCVNVKSYSEYTDPFRSEADQHDDQKMSSDLHLTGGSLQKNQGHKVLGNSEQRFTSLEECAKLSQPSTQQRDYDNAAMDFQDKRSNSMATTGAGKGKSLNTFNSECFSCISSASVTSSSTSSQGEPVSLALSSVTSQKGVLDSNRNLNLTSPPHGSLDNKRTGFCESMIASESQHVPRSTFVTQSLAGQSTVATATTSLTRQDLSTEQQSSFKDNDESRLQMHVNTAKCKNPKASVKLEENDNLKSHVTYKSIEEKDYKPEIAQGLETSRQPSVSQLNMDKKDNRETNTSLKKHIDPDTFFKVNRRLYQKLGKIGSGGSSEVYKVIASDCTIYALKKIKLKGRDYSTAYGFCQEIDYLTKLRGKNYIIQLVDYEITSKTILRDLRIAESKAKDGKINEDAYIYMVLEYGEVDLAQMLSQKWKESDVAGTQIDENWLRYYWQQILMAVNTIHEQRIVHSDLKPANFLLVKGVLKLIDFGIAKAIQSDTTNIQRESQVGTLNYMSPEAFMCNDTDENGNIIKCGRPSDIWSLGCILYQMVYGKTPFAAFTSFWSKFKEITNKNHKISFPPVSNPWLLDIMKKCLAWDRNDRLRIPQLLSHPFLKPPITTACPSMEEKYCRYLSEISEVYNANAEIQEMCEKLKSSLREKHERALELE